MVCRICLVVLATVVAASIVAGCEGEDAGGGRETKQSRRHTLAKRIYSALSRVKPSTARASSTP
jgi:hypothetical protein